MADPVDHATDRAERELQALLDRRHRFIGTSLTHCNECDTEIPERRRAALPGVSLCVDCQQLTENRRS